MATKFGRIEHSGNLFEEQTFHKNQNLTSASEGVGHHFGLKDDRTDKLDSTLGVLTTSGSYWAWSHIMFYMSGSSKVNTDEVQKFDSIYHNFNQYNDLKPFHTNKFYDTASIFFIPQQTFGERIKPGSFELTARTGSHSNTTKQIIIKDDSNGNLYSSNSPHPTASYASSISSSDNYIGNIFYDLGLAILTETNESRSSGFWSGSLEASYIVAQAWGNGGWVGDTITLSSIQGTEKTYTAAASEDLANNKFKAGSDATGGSLSVSLSDQLTSLKDCIDHASGHNGELTAGLYSTTLYIYQTIKGALGNSSTNSSIKSEIVRVGSGLNKYSLQDGGFKSGGYQQGATDIRYTDINRSGSHSNRDYRYWSMKFQSTTPIFTSQYTIKIPAGEFNHTINSTTRIQISGSLPEGYNEPEYANLRSDLTGSKWSPYFTQIQLYRRQDEEPILVGSLPRPIKMRDDVDLIITFRVDH
jgi:hypothetical protein